MSSKSGEPFLVLVADDSEDDRFLLRNAMRRTNRLEIVAEATTGSEAINYLNGQGNFKDRKKHPLPDLLLLDLKMPVKDGFAVLEWLRSQSLNDLTVVVLTDSMQPEHIKRALDMGADLFQMKPRVRHDLEAMVLALEEYLLRLVPSPIKRVPTSALRD